MCFILIDLVPFVLLGQFVHLKDDLLENLDYNGKK